MHAARSPPHSLFFFFSCFFHVNKYRTVDVLPRLLRNRTVRTGSNYFQVRIRTVGSSFLRLDPLKNPETQRICICKDFNPAAHLFLFTRIGQGRHNQKAKVVFFSSSVKFQESTEYTVNQLFFLTKDKKLGRLAQFWYVPDFPSSHHRP